MHTHYCVMQHGGATLSQGNLAWLRDAARLYDRVCGFILAEMLSFMFGLVVMNE